MPIQRRVFGISSRQGKFQSALIILRAEAVASGTTLHKIAPSKGTFPTNFFGFVFALLPAQAAVGIFAWRTTLAASPSPKWVFELPISSRRIISGHRVQGLTNI